MGYQSAQRSLNPHTLTPCYGFKVVTNVLQNRAERAARIASQALFDYLIHPLAIEDRADPTTK